MEYRNLGRTGVKVSPLCFGTDCFADPVPEKESAAMLIRAVESGINLIDTGDSYAEGEGAYHRSSAQGERAAPFSAAGHKV